MEKYYYPALIAFLIQYLMKFLSLAWYKRSYAPLIRFNFSLFVTAERLFIS